MIRKLARIDAPVEAVLEVFRDVDNWPQWMPSVASTRILSSSANLRLVEVILLVFGRRLVQKLECRERDGRLIHRQIEGWFRKWEATWAFRSPPEGQGTIVSLTLEFDLGVVSLFVPRKFIANWVGDLIAGTIENARERAQRFARRRREPTQAVRPGRPLLTVYETADGFEVQFAGRTFLIEATDSLVEPEET